MVVCGEHRTSVHGRKGDNPKMMNFLGILLYIVAVLGVVAIGFSIIRFLYSSIGDFIEEVAERRRK